MHKLIRAVKPGSERDHNRLGAGCYSLSNSRFISMFLAVAWLLAGLIGL